MIQTHIKAYKITSLFHSMDLLIKKLLNNIQLLQTLQK